MKKINAPKSTLHDYVNWLINLFGPIGNFISVVYGRIFKLKGAHQDDFNQVVASSINEHSTQITEILSRLDREGIEFEEGRNVNGNYRIHRNGYVEFESIVTIGPDACEIELTAPVQVDSGGFDSMTMTGKHANRAYLGTHKYAMQKCSIIAEASKSGESTTVLVKGSGWIKRTNH